MTINRFETEKGGMQHNNAEAVRKALEAEGIQFIDNGDTADGTGVVLVKKGDQP
ncbi:hypothetical protein [Ruegeria sp. SCSIO 43209]|uniref:hypothetical protein n=1 Tax=Ruegeria sp. SCSIO 43209 TaxID=2793010 RepID=UPI0021074F9D|nr:hypothetical protein [Ruegeria sp. SCSIO 43209]